MRLARLGLLLALALPLGAPLAAGPAAFTMGTDHDETTLSGKWARRIYVEAFRRLGVPLEIAVFPTRRLSAVVEEGAVNGEFLRVYDYAAAHPNLLRVEEPVTEISFALFAAPPAQRLSRLEDLPATGWSGDFRRGVLVCENALKPLLPAERLGDVGSTAQGIKKLLAKRADFLCDTDMAVITELLTPEFKGTPALAKLLEIKSLALYPYLHKKHAELAPRLAATLKKMKAEGLIERYRLETEREMGYVR